MTKKQKEEILYRMAKGEQYYATKEELQMLSRYRVERDGSDAGYATRQNISGYIQAVDNGSGLSFYDWCMNNLKGDRRRKSGSEQAIARSNREQGMGAMFFGWLIWGIALYWMFDETLSVGVCAVLGAIVAYVLLRVARRMAGFTLMILPIILAVIFGR